MSEDELRRWLAKLEQVLDGMRSEMVGRREYEEALARTRKDVEDLEIAQRAEVAERRADRRMLLAAVASSVGVLIVQVYLAARGVG